MRLSTRITRSQHIVWVAALALALALPDLAHSNDPRSGQYRLIGAAPASVSAKSQSPAYRVLIVGGSGQAVGISASPNTSVVAGGASTRLPTARIFRDGLEN